jgi:valyl-tRNA synthetase
VKVTPAHDPNDFAIAARHKLEAIKIMDGDAVINEKGGVYQGQDRYECRGNIVADLEKGGFLVGKDPYAHNVGHCYRCGTNIEPAVSRQWFVKIKPLAKMASTAVVKGKTKIVPAGWEATYFEWLNNIKDWCISRQIWWGHRIPVWYCDNCGETIVSTTDPDKCPSCAGISLRQEEDVLDTWFSSALWPFSTLGWPDKTEALKTFYPTSVLITAFDILFFWVARMMMMGMYIMKDVPFRYVYLHALVRDEKGEKMSKSRGNIIDPIEMIDKYGTDAFRFTLAAFTVQGRDVRISEERVAGYKFFVNKIWNATRFSLMNLEDCRAGGDIGIDEGEASLPDRWIKDRLNATIAAVVSALDEYRFNEAAAGVYQFIWHELCDWYLELIKPTLYGKGEPAKRTAAQHTLFSVLKTSLQLLHPFMPFVTEEIWQTLVNDGGSVMVSAFPSAADEHRDPEAARTMEIIMAVISKIRNIRAEMNIAPSQKLKVIIAAPDGETSAIIEEGKDYILNLAHLGTMTIGGGDVEEPKGAATGLVGSMRIFVLLEGMADIAVEKARLEKEIAKVTGELAIVSKKLANRDFLARAAEAVVKKEEEKFRELRDKHTMLNAAIVKVQKMEAA